MDRGTDHITVTFREPIRSAPEIAAGNGQIEAVEVQDGRLVVSASRGGLVAPDLVRELDDAGYEIVDLDVSRTSLEEVFVEMTRTGSAVADGGQA
jgi:ABC-2 type transport system ATP-binding protein